MKRLVSQWTCVLESARHITLSNTRSSALGPIESFVCEIIPLLFGSIPLFIRGFTQPANPRTGHLLCTCPQFHLPLYRPVFPIYKTRELDYMCVNLPQPCFSPAYSTLCARIDALSNTWMRPNVTCTAPSNIPKLPEQPSP